MASQENNDNDFTLDKITLYEKYLKTGKIFGNIVTNQYEVARLIGTSVGKINKYNQEKAQKIEKEKEKAVEDLEYLQKRTQNKLTENIVKVSLIIIISILGIVTFLYIFALVMGYELKIIESTWSNIFGIMLTNCFTIISTIMGVKYADRKIDEK